MKHLGIRLIRYTLFLVFISYFIVALIVNSDRIENLLRPLERMGMSQVVCSRDESVCLGTYAHEEELRARHVKTVVSILNPLFPFSRELVSAQKNVCRRMKIDFVSIPVSYFPNRSEKGYGNLQRFLRSTDAYPVYINGYLFDHRLESLKHRIIVKDKSLERTEGRAEAQ